MKKILSVLLAALMVCSLFSVISFAEEKYPAPEAPANLTLTEDGIASWDPVAVPSFTESDPEKYETTCVVKYKVTLSRWDYDSKNENWIYVPVGNEILTEDTSVDFSKQMVSGKFICAVTAVAEYSRTMHTTDADGNPVDKIAVFKKLSDVVELDKDSAVKVVYDI